MGAVFVPRPPRPPWPQSPDTTDIPAPPSPDDPLLAQSWVQALIMVGGGIGGVLFILVNPRPLYIFAGCVLLVATAGAAVGYAVQQRTRTRRRRRRSRSRYLHRLGRLRTATRRGLAEQRRRCAIEHPPPQTLAAVARGAGTWRRRPADPDFLRVRIGTGSVPVAGRPVYPYVDDPGPDAVLVERARRLADAHHWAPALPVTLDLRRLRRVVVGATDTGAGESRSAGPVGDPARDLVRAVLAQAVTWHAPTDLQVVAGVAPERLDEWDWLKWVPHAQHGERHTVHTDAATLERRVADETLTDGPHVLVVCDGLTLRDAGSLADLAETDPTRVTVIEVRSAAEGTAWWADVVLLPTSDGLSATGERAPATDGPLQADALDRVTTERLAMRLAACRHRPEAADALRHSRAGGLPALLGLGELGGLDRARVWATRSRRDTLRVPIGIGPDARPLHLDLKEAADGGMGPHGLIVGATGSGKSELLRTLITALAVTHPPEQLCFVLVDFKGGATFAGLGPLPHLAGLITNLEEDDTLVSRAYDALYGEIERRQRILGAAGVSSLAEYRAHAGLDPLPTLVVIVDEFSELLTQRPDFAELFATIGRLGRSLGMHLIVASQRLEEGRLRGLESHLGFRIALRTMNSADSVTAISSREAFHLPRSPGAGLLRVGAGDLVRFDAVHVSGPADVDPAADVGELVVPLRLAPIDDGPRDGSEPDLPGRPAGQQQYEVIIDRLRDDARRTHQVWLEPLPRRLPLGTLATEAEWRDPQRLRVPIGVVDLPRQQCYSAFALEFGSGAGHLLVVGAPRSGRSTLLTTLAVGLACTTDPDEAQLYVLDLGGGLRGLDRLPHVGSLAPRTDVERVVATVAHVQRVLRRRENDFAARGIDSVADLRAQRAAGTLSGPDWADVFLVVDGMAELRADHPDLESTLIEIASRGLGYGVHLVVTANRWGDVRPALRDLVPTRLELRLAEPADSLVERKTAANVPIDTPGRGLVSPGLHLQTLLPHLGGTSGNDATALAESVAHLSSGHQRRAPAVHTLPTLLTPEDLDAASRTHPGDGIAVGLSDRELRPSRVGLDRDDPHLLVFGDSGAGKTSTLRTVLRALARRGDGHAVYLVDYRRTLADAIDDGRGGPGVAAYAPTPGALDELVRALTDVLRRRMPPGDLTRAQLRRREWWTGPEEYVVIDDADLVDSVQGSPLSQLADFVPHASDIGLHLVLARRVSGAGRVSPLIARLADFGAPGLILSGDRGEGPLLGGVRAELRPVGRGRMVRRGRPAELVQTARSEPDDEPTPPETGLATPVTSLNRG